MKLMFIVTLLMMIPFASGQDLNGAASEKSACEDRARTVLNLLKSHDNTAGERGTVQQCPVVKWAERLVANYGDKITRNGIRFRNLPSLCNPLSEPAVPVGDLQLKINKSGDAFLIAMTFLKDGRSVCSAELTAAPPQVVRRKSGESPKTPETVK